jgi:hypothetical protein
MQLGATGFYGSKQPLGRGNPKRNAHFIPGALKLPFMVGRIGVI